MARSRTLISPGGYTAYRYSPGRRRGWIRVRKFQSGDWPFPLAWQRNDAGCVMDKYMGRLVAKDHFDHRVSAGWSEE